MPPIQAAGRRGGIARAAARAQLEYDEVAAPSLGVAPSGGPAATAERPVWSIAGTWRSLTRGVEWTLPFLGFLVYLATIVTNRFTVAQPAIALAVAGLMTQRRPFRVGGLGVLLVVYIAWATVTVGLSPYRGEITETYQNLLKVFVVFVVGVNAVRTRAQWRFVVAWILFWFALYPFRGSYLNYITGANVRFGRVVWNGVYANPNDLGAITLLMLSLAAALAATERPGLLRNIARAAVPLLALLISFTQSRGVLVALIVFTALTLLTGKGAKSVRDRARASKNRVRTFVAVAAAGVVFVAFAPDSMWERMRGLVVQSEEGNRDALDNDSSAQQRLAIWQVARTIVAENWGSGVGFGAYTRAHGVTAMRPGMPYLARGNRDTHSTYLNLLAEVGVIGFTLFLTIIVYTIVDAERARRRAAPGDPEGARSLLLLELGLVAYLVAAVWGTYGKLNMTYIMLLLVWTRARTLKTAPLTTPAGAADAALPGSRTGSRGGRLIPASA
jgi:hypothetical protein